MDDEFDGEFSDLNDEDIDGGDDDSYGDEEEGFDDYDDEEDLLEEPVGNTGRSERAKVVEEKENVEVNDVFFDKLVNQLEKKPGYGTLKLFLQVFVDLLSEETKDRYRKRSYGVTDLKLLNRIIKFGIEKFPQILTTASGMEITEEGMTLKKEKNHVLFKTLCNNFVRFLSQQSSPDMIIYVSQSIRQNINIFRISLQKTVKLILTCLAHWGQSEVIACKLEALLIVRDACQFVDNLHYEKVMKKAYMAFVENAKSVSWRNYDAVAFMVNGLGELYRVKPEVSYVLVFNILQGLSDRIKSLYTDNNKEKIKKLFNWKTVNTLKFIVKSVCMMSQDIPDYKQLIYPTVEVLKAMLSLFPAVQYFPLRIHVARLVVNIVEDCGVNVPLLDSFMSMLKTQHFISKKKYHASKTSMDIETTIKISKDSMGTQDLWDNIYREVYSLMVAYMSARSSALYFPELSILFYRLCNSLRKLTANPSVRTHLKNLVSLLRHSFKRTLEARKGKKLTDTHAKFKIKDLLLEERDRLAGERQEMIKMKVLAEKEEDAQGDDDMDYDGIDE